MLTSVEICTGAGGQALGLEMAGFNHQANVELDPWACQTLRLNRGDSWNVVEADLLEWSGRDYAGVDLLAGGVPCPPFSNAGKQLGPGDERDLFPTAMRLTDEIRPRAVMLENVRGLLDPIFAEYREGIDRQLRAMGYEPSWRLLNACDFGVPQLRPRVVMVAVKRGIQFQWPETRPGIAPTVGQALLPLMAERGWEGARAWARHANSIAPTLVGGSKKHGGPDLGPSRARKAWAGLGVDGRTIADEAPEPGFVGMPRLTVPMAARIQGFPVNEGLFTWHFAGRKTNAYRQVGNAFPPPVAEAVGGRIAAALQVRRLYAVA